MKKLSICLMVCLMALSLSYSAFARDVIVGVPDEGAPLVFIKDGNLKGAIGEVSQLLFNKLGYKPTISNMPFGRLYPSVETGNIDFALRVLGSEARRKVAYYTDPIITEYQLIVVPKGKSFPLAKISELNGKKLGVIHGFIYPTLDGKAAITLDPGQDNVMNVKKVLASRTDAAVVNSIFGLKSLSDADLLKEVDILPMAVAPVPLGLALAMKNFTQADLDAVNQAIKEILVSPAWETIKQTYGIAELAKPYPIAKNE